MVPVRQAEGAGNADDGVESSVSHCASSARTCRCKGKSLAAGMLRHSALDDIRASIRELKFYQETIFKPVEPISTKASFDSIQPHKTAL